VSTTRQPSRTLILFDVDGVLVHPVGYKKALHDTLDYFAAQMGLGGLGLDDHEIGVFEACGITNEWDSGALCLSTILLAALSERPDLRRATLDETLAAVRAAGLRIDDSQAGLYLWATRDEPCIDTVAWFAERGVLVAPGDFYGPAGARHVRIALTASDERVDAAVTRLAG